MSDQLIQHIRKFIPLDDGAATTLSDKLIVKKLRKKEFVLQPGQRCHANFFVLKGCLRLYFMSNKDTEQITQFGIENWWITDYDSLDTQKPSHFYIQAVEDSEILVLEQRLQEELFKDVPAFERYFRLILQKAYTASQRRMEFIFNMTDEERYRSFATRFPEFNQRVPQYMVASYLGVTPQFISRVRARSSRIS
jgi:CRP-like cAMP-binding protein